MSFNLFGGNGVKAFNQLILQSGDWVAPCDCTVVMHVGGGGGGGGGCKVNSNTSNGIAVGGAGGGYSIKRVDLNAGDVISAVIGAGGTSPTGGVIEKAGTDGGTTIVTVPTVDVEVIATGGGGGFGYINRLLSNPLTRPAGGVGSGGDYNTTGFRPFLSRNAGNTAYSGFHGGGGVNLLGLPDVSSELLVGASGGGFYSSTSGISAFGDYNSGGSNIGDTGVFDGNNGQPSVLPRATLLGLDTVNPSFYSSLLNAPTFWWNISTYIGEGMGGGIHPESKEIRMPTPFGGGAAVVRNSALSNFTTPFTREYLKGGLGAGAGSILIITNNSSNVSHVGEGGSGFLILEVYANA